MKPSPLIACAALCAVGCGAGPQSYFPIGGNRQVTYTVRTPLVTFIESVSPAENISVGGVQGEAWRGRLGTSQLAWKGDDLVLGEFPQGRFSPAVTILKADLTKASWSPNTTISMMGSPFAPAKVTVTQEPAKTPISGRRVPCLRTEMIVTSGSTTIKLTSEFMRGQGLVRQEQRTNGNFVSEIQFLSD